MLEIETVVVSPLMQNARLIKCTNYEELVLIDPGAEPERLMKIIKSSGMKLCGIWLTHSHLDHCGAVKKILDENPVKLFAHPDESFMRQNVARVSDMYGIEKGVFENCPEPDNMIKGSELLQVGEHQFQVIFTPGHSPGHLSFFNKENEVLISGDVLFSGSIGRTDLPGGDHNTLIKSVTEKLFTLPPDTKVMSGHGPDTTIGKEIKTNPFFN